MLNPWRVWAAVLTDFLASNDTVLYTEQAGDGETRLLYGLQAELFDSHTFDDSATVGIPDEVFVTASSISKLLACSPATARQWLKRFHAHGLLRHHGEVELEGRSKYLYMPVFEDAGNVSAVLNDLGDSPTGGTSPHLTEVTPGQFEATDTRGIYRYREDSSISVDVRSDSSSRSIQKRIEEQLEQEGFTPSSPHNFSYQLRDRAGLTASDREVQGESGGGGNPEPFESTTCYIYLANKESAIKGKNQAEAMANFVEFLIHETDFLKSHSLPWAPGRGYRAIINDKPRHRNGDPMDENEYDTVREGYYVYTKLKSKDKRRYIRMLAEDGGGEVTDFRGGW